MEMAFVDSPIGSIKIEGDVHGIAAVTFLDEIEAQTTVVPEALEDAVRQLKEYFSKERNSFSLHLNPKGTDFQKRVWSELEKIPFGKQASYLDMAKRLGDPKVIRAAASANGRNPIAIIIPCHRVLGSNGSLTGYAGGLHRKRWLLDHESPTTQGTLF